MVEIACVYGYRYRYRKLHARRGCITATGSVKPAGICKVFENWQTAEADDLQARNGNSQNDSELSSDSCRQKHNCFYYSELLLFGIVVLIDYHRGLSGTR
ncbi:MAG: hypothetical protein HRU29_15145 [Rhizobiales bacterium]|nr:hypothetical protein [Hyphomicrobiales bacterium]NRB15732.1 hypothetical protein [Hyphomicrobiales bacterium]